MNPQNFFISCPPGLLAIRTGLMFFIYSGSRLLDSDFNISHFSSFFFLLLPFFQLFSILTFVGFCGELRIFSKFHFFISHVLIDLQMLDVFNICLFCDSCSDKFLTAEFIPEKRPGVPQSLFLQFFISYLISPHLPELSSFRRGFHRLSQIIRVMFIFIVLMMATPFLIHAFVISCFLFFIYSDS